MAAHVAQPEELASAFPSERIPDGFVDRVSTGSLAQVLHREALADLYLRLVVPSREGLDEKDLAAHRRWAAENRTRANQLGWRPDGDVVLRCDWLAQKIEIYPDAVVHSAESRPRARVFVELDRSTKDLARIRQNLKQYGRYFERTHFGDEAVTLLYVVRSEGRKASLVALAKQLLERPREITVLREDEAVRWLQDRLLTVAATAAAATPPPPPSREERLRIAAKNSYSWIAKLESWLFQNGMRETLQRERPEFWQTGRTRLLHLHAVLMEFEPKEAAKEAAHE